jgi:hypothetical protein
MRRIILALLVLCVLAGVAAADRRHVRDHRGGVYQRHSYVQPRARAVYSRPHVYSRPRYVVTPSVRYVRKPIYVQRPVIAVRYYNYYQRPALIAENYPPMTGYSWVPGRWDWNGYEWIWIAGHYEPDPNYTGYYDNSPTYDGGYYNGGSYDYTN